YFVLLLTFGICNCLYAGQKVEDDFLLRQVGKESSTEENYPPHTVISLITSDLLPEFSPLSILR
ncbi:hypothetical protein, partial [Bacteroides heparinolyticus]|uniref:hypothetical protein n=1 Tax=Prevotella heparinolytica TaxID=28113 RepID=UPI00359F3C44